MSQAVRDRIEELWGIGNGLAETHDRLRREGTPTPREDIRRVFAELSWAALS